MTDSVQNEWNRLVQENRKAPAQPPVAPPPVRRAKRLGRWILPILFVLSLGALGLYFHGALDPAPAPPTAQELEAGQKASMMVVAKAIHDYATFHGQYPLRIEEAISTTVNIDYRRTPDGFELTMLGPDGTPIVIKGK